MRKSLRSPEYERLIGLLVAERDARDISQETLAERLDEHQSFVAKFEGGQRRLDVVEFITIVRALGADPVKLFRDFLAGKAASIPARKRPRG